MTKQTAPQSLKDFLTATSDKLNNLSCKTTIKEALAILTADCASAGFNRKALSVKQKDGLFVAYQIGR
jgi:hypothetical protein